jgi:hypothetical protein
MRPASSSPSSMIRTCFSLRSSSAISSRRERGCLEQSAIVISARWAGAILLRPRMGATMPRRSTLNPVSGSSPTLAPLLPELGSLLPELTPLLPELGALPSLPASRYQAPRLLPSISRKPRLRSPVSTRLTSAPCIPVTARSASLSTPSSWRAIARASCSASVKPPRKFQATHDPQRTRDVGTAR